MIKNVIRNSVLHEPLNYIRGKFLYHLPVRIKYGKVFYDTLNFLDESEFWPEDKIRKYQLEQLQIIIGHAYKNVPYYTYLFNSIGFKPEEFNDFADLKKIPYLTKEIIQEHREKLISGNFPKKYLDYHATDGTTGVPMGFNRDKRIHASLEWAYITHQWKRVGYNHGDKCVVLRGNIVKTIKENKKYWETNWSDNCLIMSSDHLTDETIPLYIDKIKRFKPKFIQAFPSVLQIIVAFMDSNNIGPFDSVKAIFCGSENLYNWQRQLFEQVLKTRVYSWYGHCERACLAGECEYSDYYHSFPQYGFMELINSKNDWCSQEDEQGEIVATGFGNYVMPFIRYKTQDFAINTNMKCECGRNWKIIKSVEGRLQDYLITKDHQLIPLTSIDGGSIFKNIRNLKKTQLYQNKKGIVTLKVVKGKNYSDTETNLLLNRLKDRYKNSLTFEIEFVEDIPRTKGRKFRFLVQELKPRESLRIAAT